MNKTKQLFEEYVSKCLVIVQEEFNEYGVYIDWGLKSIFIDVLKGCYVNEAHFECLICGKHMSDEHDIFQHLRDCLSNTEKKKELERILKRKITVSAEELKALEEFLYENSNTTK